MNQTAQIALNYATEQGLSQSVRDVFKMCASEISLLEAQLEVFKLPRNRILESVRERIREDAFKGNVEARDVAIVIMLCDEMERMRLELDRDRGYRR